MTSQSYILTLFGDEAVKNWRDIHDAMWESGKLLYIGSQLETCPDTGRIHWQAFVKFHRQNKQRGTWFKKFANGIHFSKCSKERSEAIGYGTKEETRLEGPKENGIKPAPAEKFDAEECKKLILAGKKDEIPFGYVLRYNLERRWKGLEEFLQLDKREPVPTWLPNPWGLLLHKNKSEKKRHYWIFSRLPNKGKTFHFAKPLAQRYLAEICTGSLDYFNVTPRTECIIFDEFNSARFKWDSLNAMCDGSYGFRICGTGVLQLKDPLIIILSNQCVADIYPYMNQFLYERFKEIELL